MKFSKSIGTIYSILSKCGIYRLKNEGLIDAELAAYDVGFKLLEEKLSSLKSERFVATASEKGLSIFEDLVGLNKRPNADDDNRRKLILNRLKINSNDYTSAKLYTALPAAGIQALLMESTTLKEVKILIREIIDPTLTLSQIEHFLGMLMPAHIDWIFDYGSITFNILDSKDFSFDKLDSLNISFDDFDQNDGSILV